MKMNKKAVILLSGGLDSATVLAMVKSLNYEIYALSFRYGQKHDIELEFAERLANNTVREHKVVDIDLAMFGGSALTTDKLVPKHENVDEIGSEIPITYVPARNTIFLSFALAYAEVIDSKDIFIGVNALDYSGYPDCRPEFIDSFQKTANLATAKGVKNKNISIHSPLINLTKSQIIRKGIELGVDYSNTISCYDPVNGLACGFCDACLLRLKGFSEAGFNDPIKYSTNRINYSKE
jgi:7-cyano-7-deazaguanine synthase